MREFFRDTWYDYYRSGLSYMDGEFYAEALWALEESLTRREARQRRDRRMARTYGMHFIDYFPHREKGIAYYYQGQYDKAEQELMLSVAQYPSDKAWLYLDRVRKAIMEKEKLPVSVPKLEAEFLSAQTDTTGVIWTRADPIPVRLSARDPQYVSELLLHGSPVFMEKSLQSVTTEAALFVNEGKHTVTVTARNLRGGQREQNFEVWADRTAPVITVEAFQPGGFLKGYLYDESGRIRLLADGRTIPVDRGKDVAFTLPPALCFGGLKLVALDQAGNRTRITVSDSMAAHAPPMLAFSGVNRMADAAMAGSSAPVISLAGWRDGDTAFKEKAEIGITVRSRNRIADVTVNGEAVPGRKGRSLSFVHAMPLAQGDNPVTIIAIDEISKKTERTLIINRKIPEAFQLKHRYAFTVCRFDQSDTCAISTQIYERLLSDIQKRQRFRSFLHQDLHAFLAASLPVPTPSEPTDCPALLLGMIYQTRQGVEVAVRLVHEASSRILAAVDAYAENREKMVPEKLSVKLSEKLHRRLPIMTGPITGTEGDTVMLKPETWRPAPWKLMPGWPLLVYRPVGSDDSQHGSDTEIIGEVLMDKMHPDHIPRANLHTNHLSVGSHYQVITR